MKFELNPILLIVFLILNTDICSSVYVKGSCSAPIEWQQKAVDVNKISGTWYFVIGTGDSDSLRCIVSDYAPFTDGSGFNEFEVGLTKFHSTWETYIDIWPQKLTSNELGSWTTYTIDESGNAKDIHKEWLLYFDDKYLVGYNCKENKFAGTFDGRIYIASRNSQGICDEDWSVILDAISRSGLMKKGVTGVADVIDQTNCPKAQLRAMLAKIDAEYIG